MHKNILYTLCFSLNQTVKSFFGISYTFHKKKQKKNNLFMLYFLKLSVIKDITAVWKSKKTNKILTTVEGEILDRKN